MEDNNELNQNGIHVSNFIDNMNGTTNNKLRNKKSK